MSLVKRIGFFLIGLSLGLVFLTFFLKKKDAEFCYLPECRVLKNIRNKPIEFSAEVKPLFSNNTLSEEQLNYMLTTGDVIFSESDTKARPCKKYKIRGYSNDLHFEFIVDNCHNKAIIQKMDILK